MTSINEELVDALFEGYELISKEATQESLKYLTKLVSEALTKQQKKEILTKYHNFLNEKMNVYF